MVLLIVPFINSSFFFFTNSFIEIQFTFLKVYLFTCPSVYIQSMYSHCDLSLGHVHHPEMKPCSL